MTRCVRGTYGVRYHSTGDSVTSVHIVSQVSVLRHIFERIRLPLRKRFDAWLDVVINGYRHIIGTSNIQTHYSKGD
jgi:hypothetical protein